MNDVFPSHSSNLSASIGDKPHFGDKRDEKTRLLQRFGRGGGDRTIKRTDATQVIDSTFRSIRNNR
jgi:hypothetical protein